MTALPSSNIVGRTDAELASAAAAGDRGAFAGIYDRYADRLHDFCVGMLRDREAAADCVQDVFCAAATRLGQLREPDKLRPWLYAIARNEALRQIRERRREELYEEVPDMASRNPGPDTLAARGELADLIAEAAGGLSDRDRSVLELAYRHGLDGPELADVLGVSPVNANVMVYRLRETIERSLGALLVARGARRNPTRCPELAAILVGWDGAFTVLMRKRIARHIESCSVCEQDRRRLVNPVALLGGAPVFIPAPAWLRAHTLNHIQLVAASTGMPTGAPSSQLGSQSAPQPQHSMHRPWSGTPGATTLGPGDNNVAAVDEDLAEDVPGRASGHLLLLIALFAATLIASAGLTILWLSHPNDAIPPTGLSSATPPPAAPAPAVVATPDLPPPPAADPVRIVPALPTPAHQEPTRVQLPAPAALTDVPAVTPVPPVAPPPVAAPIIPVPAPVAAPTIPLLPPLVAPAIPLPPRALIPAPSLPNPARPWPIHSGSPRASAIPTPALVGGPAIQ